METFNENILNVCMPENVEHVKQMLSNLPTSTDEICLVCNDDIAQKAKDVFSSAIANLSHDGYKFQWGFLKNDSNPSQVPEICNSVRFGLIMDATRLLNGAEVSFLDYMANSQALRSHFSIFVINTAMVMSITEIKRNVKVVLGVKGLDSEIFTDDSADAESWLKKITQKGDSSLDVIIAEKQREILEYVQGTLNAAKSSLLDNIKSQEDGINEFNANCERFNNLIGDVKVELWLQIKKFCDANLDKDITTFAHEALNAVNKQLKEVNPNKIKYYYSRYVNYLWQKFLSFEASGAISQISDTLYKKIDDLTEKFHVYFGEEIYVPHFDADTEELGVQSVVGNIDRVHPVCKYIFVTIGNVLLYGFPVLLFYKKFLRRLGRGLYEVFGIKYHGDNLRKVFIDATFEQFDKSLDEIKQQLIDLFIPLLEKNYNEAIDRVNGIFNEQISNIRNNKTKSLDELHAKESEIENRINLLDNLK